MVKSRKFNGCHNRFPLNSEGYITITLSFNFSKEKRPSFILLCKFYQFLTYLSN